MDERQIEEIEERLGQRIEDQVWARSSERAIERAAIDDSGERLTFSGIAASNGEASDGHILSIEGLSVADRQPLLFGHMSTADVPILGAATKPKKTTRGKTEKLRMTGEINTKGDDPLAGIRRGIAGLVADGDLEGLSIRWVPTEQPLRRINLPSNHPAFVKESDTSERRWGLFFPKAAMRELSVVAIGADPSALIGRANRLDDDPVFRSVLRGIARELERGGDDLEAAVRVASLCSEASILMRACGMDSRADSLLALIAGLDTDDAVRYRYVDDQATEQVVLLPRSAWESLRGESADELRAALALRRAALPATPRGEVTSTPLPSPAPVQVERTEESELRGLGEFLTESLRITPEQIREIAGAALKRARGGDA